MAASIGMYVSYITNNGDNLAGHKGNPIQPLVAAINCLLWLAYGFFKKPKRDFPIILANLPGIIFGLIAFGNSFVIRNAIYFAKVFYLWALAKFKILILSPLLIKKICYN